MFIVLLMKGVCLAMKSVPKIYGIEMSTQEPRQIFYHNLDRLVNFCSRMVCIEGGNVAAKKAGQAPARKDLG